MKLSEVLCLVLPFIIVIMVLSIDNKEDKGEGFDGQIKLPKPEKEEYPEEPEEPEEKTYGFVPSIICAFTPILGDYGCVQRDALLHEKETSKYEKEIEKIKLKNNKKDKELDKKIEKAKVDICSKLGCKNESSCDTIVNDGDMDNKGDIVISGLCDCVSGFHGKDCGTVLEVCTATDNCNGKGVPKTSTKYNIPDIGCKCDCEDGYGGDDCSEEYTQCTAAEHCSSHGETKGYDLGNGCVCDCQEGWEGDDCSIRKVPCTAEDCSNAGVPKDGSYRPNAETGREKGCECECDGAHEGDKCEKLKDIEWSKSECVQDQTCQELRSNGTSRCINNYYQSIDSNQVPTCNECPPGSQNVNPSSSKGGKRINPRLGSSSISDCICDNDNEYLDVLTTSCEVCPENTIKSRSIKGDITDCTCDTSRGWYDNPNWTPSSTDQERCIRCGWDENEEKLKQGFIYEVTEENGVKVGECKCAPSFDQVDGGDEGLKCFPTGKCSTTELSEGETFGGLPKESLNDYKRNLVNSANDNGEPQNICNGIGSRSQLANIISELDHKDIRLQYDNDGEIVLDDNSDPMFSELGDRFMSKISCNSANGRCSCPGSSTMYLRDNSDSSDIVPCQECAPARNNSPKYLTYDENKDRYECSSSECFDRKDDNTLKGLGCLNYENSERNRTKRTQENPLNNASGPLIFKDNDVWKYYNASGVETTIEDSIPDLCNSDNSPPKCGSKEGEDDICTSVLGVNWEEKQDADGNSRCACNIAYEDRKEINGKKACTFDTSKCDLYSQDPACNVQDIYQCPAWTSANDQWNPKDFRLWGMAHINNIGTPGTDGDIQLDNDGNITESGCKDCFIPPPINPDGAEEGNPELSEVKNSSLFAGLPKKLSLSYMNDKGQWIHYCKPKTGTTSTGYASEEHSFNALNPFTIMNDSSKPLPEGKTSPNTSINDAEGVCGKAQYYDIDQKKCFNIGGGCYSRGAEAGWYTKDIGDFYNLGLPACNFKSNVSLSDVDTHDDRSKAGIADKGKITQDEGDIKNLCCQSCHYKFYSPNSSSLTNGEPKTTIYDKSKFTDLQPYLLPAKYYGPSNSTPPTNHAGCVGGFRPTTTPQQTFNPWRGGRPFCSPGQKGIVKHGMAQQNYVMDSTEDDHPVATIDKRSSGPWVTSFNWHVQGIADNCGGSSPTDIMGAGGSTGSCGRRNDSFSNQRPRRATVANYLTNAEGGGYAGMTGHADVTPRNQPDSDHRGDWGSGRNMTWGAHGYSGDSGFGVSTEDIYQKGWREHWGEHIMNSYHGKDILTAHKNQEGATSGAPWANNARGKGRRNPIGWNNQESYTVINGGNSTSVSGDSRLNESIDPRSGKRNHWLAENGSTLPITGVGGASLTTVERANHDECHASGIGNPIRPCTSSNRKVFDHHANSNKNAKGIGYPGIKVPSVESTKKIYGGAPGPFARIDINHATGFNSLPTDYYLHNHPSEGDGPYHGETGVKQTKAPAHANFADYGDNEFDVENKTHEQGKRYENLFYCKRSLGTPRDVHGGDDYKNMISGASIDRTGYMDAKMSKGSGGASTHVQHGAQGQWAPHYSGGHNYHLNNGSNHDQYPLPHRKTEWGEPQYQVVDDIVDGGKHPINAPHLYVKNLITLGKYGWPLQSVDKLNSANSIKNNISFLGANAYQHTGTHATTSNTGQKIPDNATAGYTKDTSHIPKAQHGILGGEEPVRALVPRELNNMAYYDTEYGGWIQRNQTYQGTYLSQKWLRPYQGSSTANKQNQTFWDRGGKGDRGSNDTHVLQNSGCRNWNWAGNGGWAWGYIGGRGLFSGRPGLAHTGSNAHNSLANPVVTGAGGEGTWHERSHKLNGKYGSCKAGGDARYMILNEANARTY